MNVFADDNEVYKLSVNTQYIVFSTDIIVNYSLQLNRTELELSLQLFRFNSNNSQLVESVAVPHDATNGHVTIHCGVIRSRGRYAVRLNENQTETLAEVNLNAEWPPVSLTVARTNYTVMRDDIEVRLMSSGKCIDWSQFTLLLCRTNEADQSKHCEVMFRSSVNSLVVTIPCGIVQRPGKYLLQLADSNGGEVVAESTTLEMMANTLYSLSPIQLSALYDCQQDVTVAFNRPRCAFERQVNDKIRLYKQQMSSNDIYFHKTQVSALYINAMQIV
jgi:hypothetical protein